MIQKQFYLLPISVKSTSFGEWTHLHTFLTFKTNLILRSIISTLFKVLRLDDCKIQFGWLSNSSSYCCQFFLIGLISTFANVWIITLEYNVNFQSCCNQKSKLVENNLLPIQEFDRIFLTIKLQKGANASMRIIKILRWNVSMSEEFMILRSKFLKLNQDHCLLVNMCQNQRQLQYSKFTTKECF